MCDRKILEAIEDAIIRDIRMIKVDSRTSEIPTVMEESKKVLVE